MPAEQAPLPKNAVFAPKNAIIGQYLATFLISLQTKLTTYLGPTTRHAPICPEQRHVLSGTFCFFNV
jgi:hypothetical protein